MSNVSSASLNAASPIQYVVISSEESKNDFSLIEQRINKNTNAIKKIEENHEKWCRIASISTLACIIITATALATLTALSIIGTLPAIAIAGLAGAGIITSLFFLKCYLDHQEKRRCHYFQQRKTLEKIQGHLNNPKSSFKTELLGEKTSIEFQLNKLIDVYPYYETYQRMKLNFETAVNNFSGRNPTRSTVYY